MFTKIILDRFASYKDVVEIDVGSHLNFFYGLNGTGKTALSCYLQDRDNKKYRHCSTKGGNGSKIFVFNTFFVENTFYTKEIQKGVFTIGKKNKEVEEAITKANNKINDIKRKKEILNEQKENILEKRNDILHHIEEKLWKIKEKYERTELDLCLIGVKGSKKSLFEKVLQTEINTVLHKTTDDLQNEAKNLLGNDAEKKQSIQVFNPEIASIESDPIFEEPIVGTEENPLSNLIQKLNNADWVKHGIPYLLHSRNQCPFCQQEVDSLLVSHIKNYFGHNYRVKIQQLTNLKFDYEQVNKEISDYESITEPILETHKCFEESLQELKNAIEQNIQIIECKIESPSQQLKLQKTTQKIEKLNISIQEINKKINEHNQQVTDKKGTENRIKLQFWQLMRDQYDVDIDEYKKNKQKLCKHLSLLQQNINILDESIKKLNLIISDNQNKITNIERSITNINQRLNEFALEGFQIEKQGDNFYKIKRDNGSGEKNEFYSLSEGEKTLVSFLYFIEVCKGTEDSTSQVDLANRIVVIDDPVSSLSHTYVFDIAQLIKNEFFEKFKQLFILTHSLYFLSEVIKTKLEKKLFRIHKYGKTSIKDMKKDEIQNEYQAFWQVIRDYEKKPSSVSSVLIANSMRNILECFFGFIYADSDFRKTKERLTGDYSTFLRFMDRKSHSDAVNITVDSREINPSRFMEAFKEVFKEAGFESHYNTMMGKN